MDAAQASSASSVPSAGTLVAERYRIGRVLGEGGMGVVLAATDESTGDEVALKLLQAVGQANAERFLREARLTSRIESEHAVRVFDMGNHAGHPFIVMERLRGRDFGAKLRTFRLTLTEVADCIIQACEALAHAHGEGIVHRDIKASNLFEAQGADGQPIVKVLDFGISRTSWLDDSPTELTVTKTQAGLLGSPPYMSPEHIRDPRHLDGRADLWSLGVVAFRLLTTKFPFDGVSSAEILVSILERRPPTLRDAGADVPQEIEDIVARCLARSRDDRFQHAGELAAAISPFASPRWHSFASVVPEIVASARVGPPRPGEGPESRAAAKGPAREPTTRTVSPPVAAAIPPRSAELDVDRGLEFAPTAILTSGGASPLPVTVVQAPARDAAVSDSDLVATAAASMPSDYYESAPTPPGVYRPSTSPAASRRQTPVPANRLLALAVFTLLIVLVGVRAFAVHGGPEVATASRARAPVPVPVPSLQPPAAVTPPSPVPLPALAPIPAPAATSAVAPGVTSAPVAANPAPREPLPPPKPSRSRPPRHTWTAPPSTSPAPPPPPPAVPRSELQPNPYAKTP